MSRRSPILEKESRPSFSRATRMALSYLALFVFTAFALYPISRIVMIALRPGDQLLSTSLAPIPAGATLANFQTLLFHTPFLRWLGNSTLIALAVTITRRFILSTTNPPGPSLAGLPRAFATAFPLAPGMQGRALAILRPSGKAEFENHVVDVVTEGDFIAPETPVAIVSTDGMRVVVKGVAT
jgi:hypothetical protein